MLQENMTYADICERLEEVAPGATVLVTSSSSGSSGRRTYPLATLREKDPEKLPPEVEPTHKEVRLAGTVLSACLLGRCSSRVLRKSIGFYDFE